jgi:hypothetical protein
MSIPMRKVSTGEPCAGKLHARFGGRGELRGSSLPQGKRIKTLENSKTAQILLIFPEK